MKCPRCGNDECVDEPVHASIPLGPPFPLCVSATVPTLMKLRLTLTTPLTVVPASVSFCPSHAAVRAVFYQDQQTKRAESRMTLFYVCT